MADLARGDLVHFKKREGAFQIFEVADYTVILAKRELIITLDANDFDDFQDDAYCMLFDQCLDQVRHWQVLHLKAEGHVVFTRHSFTAVGPPHQLDQPTRGDDQLSRAHNMIFDYLTDTNHTRGFHGQFLLKKSSKVCIEALLRLAEDGQTIKILIFTGPFHSGLKNDIIRALCGRGSTIIDNDRIIKFTDYPPNLILPYDDLFDMVVINNLKGQRLRSTEPRPAPDSEHENQNRLNHTVGFDETGVTPFPLTTELSAKIEFGWLDPGVPRPRASRNQDSVGQA